MTPHGLQQLAKNLDLNIKPPGDVLLINNSVESWGQANEIILISAFLYSLSSKMPAFLKSLHLIYEWVYNRPTLQREK